MRFVIILTLALLSCGFVFAPAAPDSDVGARDTDREAVARAARDYLESIYDVKPELIEKSVHPKLTKIGYSWRKDGYREMAMSYEQLVKLAGSYNKSGAIPADAPRKIEVLDVLDKIAVVKLTASWGIDYMHLTKLDGKWKIVHVLWQSHPEKRKKSSAAGN